MSTDWSFNANTDPLFVAKVALLAQGKCSG